MNSRIELKTTSDASTTTLHDSTILIVDDTASNLQVVTAHLEEEGFRVVIARNGEEALRLAGSIRPDLVLLDVIMPGMNGFETCRHLKANEATANIPVIFMTALTATNDKVTGFETGGVDYVTKPFQIAEVLARINTHLALRRMQQQLAAQNVQLQQEVQERRRAEEALRVSEVRYRGLFETANDGILLLDSETGQINDVNTAFIKMFGYSYEEFLGKALWEIEPFKAAPSFQTFFEQIHGDETVCFEQPLLLTKSGARIDVEFVGNIYQVDNANVIQCNIRDITKRAQAEERIRYMATHDALTGLPNRALLADRVRLAIAQARRQRQQVALLFIDLDHFKYVNDSLGHTIGDQLLQLAATRLQSCLRESDSIARLGGDEFVVMLPGISQNQDAAVVAKKIIDSISQPFAVNDQMLHVNASIGISFFPTDGGDAQALIGAADAAMYHAKEKGRGNYQFFTPALNAAMQQRVTLVNRLHYALSNNEFVLHYQPQVDMRSGEIIATEALLRWQPPNSRMVPPLEFIHVAEETGLIVPLGEWVLRQACAQLKHWRDNGQPNLRMAINLSVRQFDQPHFQHTLTDILNETGVPASALDLEITESYLVRQVAQDLVILDELAAMGAQITIDDFGMGYSALSYFQRFPIHALKIDRSFVSRIGRQSNDTIVTTIIAMAKGLGLRVIAEGVGNQEQASFLTVNGCWIAQGFFYSRPVPADMFSEFLRTHVTACSVR
ncbi:MAG: EAL domain-containing protein [Gammaproteobacteria bacterium]|nr:EAL domain-containing protein [Gammaproteobacteria bacterium]